MGGAIVCVCPEKVPVVVPGAPGRTFSSAPLVLFFAPRSLLGPLLACPWLTPGAVMRSRLPPRQAYIWVLVQAPAHIPGTPACGAYLQ